MVLETEKIDEAERLITRLMSDASTLFHAASLLKFASTSGSIADFVNATAPNLGGVLQKSLETQIIVSLARMSDKPGSGRKSRASIRRLRSIIEQTGIDYDFEPFDQFLKIAGKIKKVRNEFIVHRNMSASEATACSLDDYEKAGVLACDIVSNFCLDILGYEALFQFPHATDEFQSICEKNGVSPISS